MSTVAPYTIGLAFLIVVFAILQYTRRLPSVESIQELATAINTKGGNILMLAGFSLVFFFTGLGLIYWSLNRMLEGKLAADNAVLMTGLSWILGSAFGGSFSSMLKVMSGENPQPPNATTATTTVATTSTEPPKEDK